MKTDIHFIIQKIFLVHIISYLFVYQETYISKRTRKGINFLPHGVETNNSSSKISINN